MQSITKLRIGLVATLLAGFAACKQRGYNQSKTKDLVGGSDANVTLCSMVTPFYMDAATQGKANVRVACQGQCNGADYRNRKFYLDNEEKIQGFEFSVKLTSGKEMRNLFVFNPENGLLASLNGVKLENPEVQKALEFYSLDPASVSDLSVPKDSKVLLNTGTRASLSVAGLFDGGTLDCGGQPIEGSVDLNQFKEQNLQDIKNSAAGP